jgi:c-di-AMP phosphodiesterase-like protein
MVVWLFKFFIFKLVPFILFSILLVRVCCSHETFKSYIRVLGVIVVLIVTCVVFVIMSIRIIFVLIKEKISGRFKSSSSKLKESFEKEVRNKNSSTDHLMWFERDLFAESLNTINKMTNSRRRFVCLLIFYFMFLLAVLCVTIFLK